MRTAILAILVTGVMFFAGCVASEEEGDGKGLVPPTAPSAQYDDETGAIAGLVRDPEFVGLAGAQVGLLQTDFVTKTALDGSFTFSRIAPGQYVLVAQRLGYASGETKVLVEAGKETSGVEIELAPLAVVEPYYTVEPFEGYIVCSISNFALASEECGNGVGTPAGHVGGNAKSKIDWNFNITKFDGLTDVYIELTWDGTTATSRDLGLHVARGLVCQPDCKADTVYCSVFENHGPPVQKCEILAEDLGIKDASKDLPWEITARAWVAPTKKEEPPNVLLEQPFMMYKTEFFHMEKPEGYTAVPAS